MAPSFDASDYYGTPDDGDDYFAKRLNSAAWDDSTDVDKQKALCEATRLIDRLNFKGAKTEEDQVRQFPRSGDTEVPQDIEFATYEVAIKLLDEIDPDIEMDELRTSSEGYSSVRVNKDTGWGQEYLQAGIPSSRAWHLIRPYLRDPREIVLQRV